MKIEFGIPKVKPLKVEKEDDAKKLDGTYLQGHLNASYQQLCATFGSPRIYVNDDKVRAEWMLRFTEGDRVTYATIYDWKRDEPVEDVKEWNIGGFGWASIDCVVNALKGLSDGGVYG